VLAHVAMVHSTTLILPLLLSTRETSARLVVTSVLSSKLNKQFYISVQKDFYAGTA